MLLSRWAALAALTPVRHLLDGMLLRDMVSMMKVFDRLDIRNLVCWNSMIIGHCVYDEPGDTIQLFHEMRSDEVGTFGFIYANTSLRLHEFFKLDISNTCLFREEWFR
jgi:pentatricopeptide repeat protein